MSTEDNATIGEQCKGYFIKQIDSGAKCDDFKSFHDLKRKCMRELKIKYGSMGIVKLTLEQVLESKGLKIPKQPTKSNDGISADIAKPADLLPSKNITEESKEPKAIITSPRGTLPKTTETDNTETKKEFLPDPQQREKQEETTKNSVGGIIQIIFERIGVLEPKVKPKDEKEKLEQSEQLRKDIDDFSKELGGVLYDNGIVLPSFLKYIDLGIKGYKAIAQPLLSRGFSSEESPQQTPEEKNREEALKNA